MRRKKTKTIKNETSKIVWERNNSNVTFETADALEDYMAEVELKQLNGLEAVKLRILATKHKVSMGNLAYAKKNYNIQPK